MSQDRLDQFGAYRKALELFDLVVEDTARLLGDPRAHRLASQQVASSDSVCANIEEGYGRGTRREYIQYLVIARGSARETRGRYLRFKHWLPEETVKLRVALCDEALSVLYSSIRELRNPRD
jgi:four helix bundle protein